MLDWEIEIVSESEEFVYKIISITLYITKIKYYIYLFFILFWFFSVSFRIFSLYYALPYIVLVRLSSTIKRFINLIYFSFFYEH